MKLLILLLIAAVHAQDYPPLDGPPLVVTFDELAGFYNFSFFIEEYRNISQWCEHTDRKKQKKKKKSKSKKKKTSSKKKSSKKSKKKSKKKGKGSTVYCPTEEELRYSRNRELCIAYSLGWSYDDIWNQTIFQDTLFWNFPPDLAFCLINETDQCYYEKKDLCEVYSEECCLDWIEEGYYDTILDAFKVYNEISCFEYALFGQPTVADYAGYKAFKIPHPPCIG